MKEFDVKTDDDFYKRLMGVKDDVQNIANMFQNEGTIVNEEEVHEWTMDINKAVDKLERLKKDGYARFSVRD